MNDQKASILFRQNYQTEAHIVINQGGPVRVNLQFSRFCFAPLVS